MGNVRMFECSNVRMEKVERRGGGGGREMRKEVESGRVRFTPRLSFVPGVECAEERSSRPALSSS